MSDRQKIILKSALITLAAIALAALTVFSMWILCAPQTMATSCEKTGNYSFAVTCANLRYSYTKSAYDLSRCVDDSILDGNDKLVVKYGEKLIAHDKFSEVCKSKSAELSESLKVKFDYRSHVCGNVAYSQFKRGDLSEAVKTAQKSGTEAGFIKLTVAVSESGTDAQKKALYDLIYDTYGDLAALLK